MLKAISIKMVSQLLLVVLLVTVVSGAFERARAMSGDAAGGTSVSHSEISAPHEAPAAPLQDDDCDGCDACMECGCHAPFPVKPFQLKYAPTILALTISDPFKHLPEVYRSKFIPPQLNA